MHENSKADGLLHYLVEPLYGDGRGRDDSEKHQCQSEPVAPHHIQGRPQVLASVHGTFFVVHAASIVFVCGMILLGMRACCVPTDSMIVMIHSAN